MQSLQHSTLAFLYAAASPLRYLPESSWGLILMGALALWPALLLCWSILRWARDLVAKDDPPKPITLVPSSDDYILLSQWDAPWIKGADKDNPLQSKATTLLIEYGKRKAKGTVRYSQASALNDDVLGLPESVADALGLSRDKKSVRLAVSVRVARRFPIEALWNSADPSIKSSFRTAVWIAAITTTLSLGEPIVQSFVMSR